MRRDELEEKIRQTEVAIKWAGPIHRRDLQKHIRRMKAQLAQYNRFQAATRQEVG